MRQLILAVATLSLASTAWAQAEDEESTGGASEGSATVTNAPPEPGGKGGDAPNASHTVERGDTLWDLSRKFLGSPWYWPKVWSYNPDIANPHWIYPGNMVRFYGADEQPTQVEVGTEVPDVEEGTMYDEGEGVSKAGQIGYRAKNSVTLPIQAFVTTKELEQNARVVGSFAENEMLTFPFSVYVDISGKKSLKVGDATVVYRTGGEIQHPLTHDFIGYITQVVAEGKVIAVDTKKNLATMAITRSLDELHRGDSVSPAGESVIRTVAPRANDRELKGAVLVKGAKRFTLMQSEGFVVILDRGADDGVKVGNTFTFFRSGDTSPVEHHFNPQYNDDTFPREIVGACMVVDVKSKASTCLLTYTLRELLPGDVADMVLRAPRTATR
ncbi:MAG: LysM peptidoglycan-binding domain-containing protein [Archangiaceae bacterium]|nr:LysM peptidoglycan-binding domain-containing protein [Archangiaceae bacterium]